VHTKRKLKDALMPKKEDVYVFTGKSIDFHHLDKIVVDL